MQNNIQEMFNGIAKSYDKLNDIMSFGQNLRIKKTAVNNADLSPAAKVLDICTGTGDIAIYLAKNIVKQGSVIGIDFSKNMLEIAKGRAENIQNLSFVEGDAMDLPFDDETFDACIISFGLRNLPDIKKAIEEMKRVTKSGGLIVNLDTGKPKGIVKFFHKIYIFNVIPFFGKIFHGDDSAYKYLPQSIENFVDCDQMVHIFEKEGLVNIRKFNFIFDAISQQIGQVKK